MENAGLPRGNIMFSQDQIDFGFKPGNIYVVSYTCAKEPGEMVQEAVSVTLEKMHPCADYAKVWIDGNGEVNTAEETVLQTGDIAQVRYVGLITAYRTDNGTGYISGNTGSMSTISQMPGRRRSWFWGAGFRLRSSRP